MSATAPVNFGIQRPIFIVGALRSGTTVFRLMLGCHDDIGNLGEGDFILDYVHEVQPGQWAYDRDALRRNRVFRSRKLTILDSGDARVIAVDFVKQVARAKPQRPAVVMSVHRHADKVAALFPELKVLHIIRDPRDVARSCIGMGWAGNTYFGIDGWLETEANWDASEVLFNKANVMEVRFEDLILNCQGKLEEVCRFLGLPFSPNMLNYHAHSTYDAPDPSTVQQWKKKSRPRETALMELKVKPLLLARKYELSGHPLDPPGPLERLRLSLDNKVYKWKYGCRHYGAFNFLMEKITRWVPQFHDVFQNRINEITTSHLK